jgi:hypothetical protein
MRCETDRYEEQELAVGDLGWRWWKWIGALDQVERLGIEKGRPGTFDNPAAHNFTLPINGKGNTDHTFNAERVRRISLKPCEVRYQRLLPTCSRRGYGCRRGRCRNNWWRFLRLRLLRSGPNPEDCAKRDNTHGTD